MYLYLFSHSLDAQQSSNYNASNFNASKFSYFHVTEPVLQKYPQLREAFQAMNGTFQYMTNYTWASTTGVECRSDRGGMYAGGGEGDDVHIARVCSAPIIPFKMTEASKVRDALQMDKYNGRLQYNGEHYQTYLESPNLNPIYSTSLLYGIIISVIGSVAIWLLVARIEGRRNNENNSLAHQ
jgi:hypothetical protein